MLAELGPLERPPPGSAAELAAAAGLARPRDRAADGIQIGVGRQVPRGVALEVAELAEEIGRS